MRCRKSKVETGRCAADVVRLVQVVLGMQRRLDYDIDHQYNKR